QAPLAARDRLYRLATRNASSGPRWAIPFPSSRQHRRFRGQIQLAASVLAAVPLCLENAATRPAVAAPSPTVRILVRVLMALRAMRRLSVLSSQTFTTEQVLAPSDRLEM